ncbi:MAG: hypothetical protein AB7U05_08615 [Mangrovibacterium sp.]
MKKLVFVLAVVFAFGVTYALNVPVNVEKAGTEQVSSMSQDDKEKKKECCAEKKEACSEKKTAEEKKACCAEKKSCGEKK